MKKKTLKIITIAFLAIILVIFGAVLLITNDLYSSLKQSPATNETIKNNYDYFVDGTESHEHSNNIEHNPQQSNIDTNDIGVNDTDNNKDSLDELQDHIIETLEINLGSEKIEFDTKLESTIKDNISSMQDTDSVLSILLIGNDNRDVDMSERTDCVFLVSINQNSNRLIITSFPQNLYVYVPDWDNTSFLQYANVLGGPRVVTKTIEQNFGVKIDAYATVGFDSFANAVDSVGGLNMSLSSYELDQIASISGTPQEVEPQMYNLNGNQTLAYCSSQTDDPDHTSRRFTVIKNLLEQSRNVSLVKRYEILKQILKDITTTVSIEQCIQIMLDVTDLRKYKMIQVQLPKQGLYEERYIDESTVLIPDIEANTKYIRETIYN